MKLIKKLSENFTVINNNILRCKELSNSAKGLYCVLISLPDEWSFSAKGLSNISSDGVTSIRTSLIELERVGLLRREKRQNSKGHWIVEYFISDEIIISNENTANNLENLNTDIVEVENPTSEIPMSENPTSEIAQTYKELNNKELNNKIKNNKNIYKFDFKKNLILYGFNEKLVDEWLFVRSKKNGVNTETAFNDFVREVEKSGIDKNEVLRTCVARSWVGFKANWIVKNNENENESALMAKLKHLK